MRERFQDPKLLDVALTHRSWVQEHPDEYPFDHYQRLEFLGDAVVQLVATELLYHALPNTDEGLLTDLRQHLVRGETLAELGRALGLGEQVRLGRGAAQSGDRDRDKLLADVLESTVGALYLDQGLEAACAYLRPLMAPLVEAMAQQPGPERAPVEQAARPPVNLLQEWSQKRGLPMPSYGLAGVEGTDHARRHVMVVQVTLPSGEVVCATGVGARKKDGNAAAAAAALARLAELGLTP